MSNKQLHFDNSFRLCGKISDSDLQDYCGSIKSRMNQLFSIDPSPIATVVLSAHNEELYLPGTLDSLSQVQKDIPVEIIVVDNASSDNTAEIARECGVTVVRENRKGLSYARQSGLEAAKGAYIFTTDADVRFPNSWISSNLGYFTRYAELVCFSGGIHQPIHPLHRILRTIPKFVRIIKGTDEEYQAGKISGGNMVYKKDIALQVGGYDGGYDLGEDARISQKLAQKGKIQAIFSPETRVDVSARRINTASKVVKFYASLLSSSVWLDKKNVLKDLPNTFSDIR